MSFFVVYGYLRLVCPLWYSEVKVKGFFAFEFCNFYYYLAFPRVVGLLLNLYVSYSFYLCLKDVGTIEVYIYAAVVANGVGIVLCFAKCSKSVWRAAEAANIFGSFFRPP